MLTDAKFFEYRTIAYALKKARLIAEVAETPEQRAASWAPALALKADLALFAVLTELSTHPLDWNTLPLALTTAQVAEILQIEQRTTETMCRHGRLPAVRIGQHWRVPREALYAYVHPAPTQP